MIKYPQSLARKLQNDKYAEIDAAHDAILELLGSPTDKERNLDLCVNTRARYREIDEIRKRKSLATTNDAELMATNEVYDPVFISQKNESRQEVALALKKMKNDEQKILRERFYEGKSLNELASTRSKTVQAVSTQIHRALIRLKAHIHHDKEA